MENKLLLAMEAIDGDFDRLWEEGEIDDSKEGCIIHKRKDMHPMSGYGSRFEYLEVEYTLTEENGKFKVHDTSNRVSGPIPGFMNEELQEGERDWDDDEIYDLTSDSEEKSDDVHTFDDLKKAMEWMNMEFEG